MFTLNCKGRLIVIDEPIVMGIINPTPDSFYMESRARAADEILLRAEKMISEGALIIDIGGQSTRPGSDRINVEEELSRVIPAIEAVHQKFPEQIISVDTFHARVARSAVEAGASIINDISAGSLDQELIPVVASMKVPYVLMHMSGSPKDMQQNPYYENVTLEVFDFLSFRIQQLSEAGISDIIVDPGFGFGKTLENNFQLLNQLSFLKRLERPLMVGLSRKGMIYKTLGITTAEALNGTTAAHTIALMNGVNILRAHDVKEAIQAIEIYKASTKQKEQ